MWLMRFGLCYVPNEMTPIAWNMPELMVRSGVVKEPRASEGVMKPCTTTVRMMMIMLMRASVLAFASCARGQWGGGRRVVLAGGAADRDVPWRCLCIRSGGS